MNFCNVMLTFSTFSNKKDFGVLFFKLHCMSRRLCMEQKDTDGMIKHARARTFFSRFLGLIPLIGYKNDPLGTTYNFALKFCTNSR